MAESRKIMVIRRDPMTTKGLLHWSKGAREKVHRYVYKNKGVRQCPYSVLKNRNTFAQWLFDFFGTGYFLIFTWREGYYKKRSIKRLRPYRIARIIIDEDGSPDFIELTRISRFAWFEPKQ